MSLFAPPIAPVRLTMEDLEAMGRDEVEIRLAYGRAPVRSMADFRDWIWREHERLRHEGPPYILRLSTNEANDFASDICRIGASFVFETPPPDGIAFEGRYLCESHGIHIIEDSPA